MVYADDGIIFVGSVHTIKENTGISMLASMEIGIEVNADKSKYTVMSTYHKAGRVHSTKTVNRSFEMVVEFKHLVTT